MLTLVQFFFRLCLLRATPQDLPPSSALFGLAFVADLLMGTVLASMFGIAPGSGLVHGLVDILVMLAILYGALYLLGRRPRFLQSATAILGSAALLECIAAVPLSLLSQGDASQLPELATLLFLVLIVWGILVAGHILRHTFELRLGQGIGIAVIYNYFAYSLASALFSGS